MSHDMEYLTVVCFGAFIYKKKSNFNKIDNLSLRFFFTINKIFYKEIFPLQNQL
jgi:hypothetical protein